jgi:hypothetical protein
MILHCNFEELRALSSAGELILAAAAGRGMATAVHAGPGDVAKVEMLLPRLTGDFSIECLADQRGVREAVDYICRDLHHRMDEKIVEYHPAHEEAVALYFDYGHSRTVLHRLEHMGAEMEALAELMGGGAEAAGRLTFPDS